MVGYLRTDKGNIAKQQTVVSLPDGDYFYSYNTLVAKRADGKIYLGEAWCYSKTTLKYLKQFIGTRSSKAEIEALLDAEFYGRL